MNFIGDAFARATAFLVQYRLVLAISIAPPLASISVLSFTDWVVKMARCARFQERRGMPARYPDRRNPVHEERRVGSLVRGDRLTVSALCVLPLYLIEPARRGFHLTPDDATYMGLSILFMIVILGIQVRLISSTDRNGRPMLQRLAVDLMGMLPLASVLFARLVAWER
jgi:hypothetical protein